MIACVCRDIRDSDYATTEALKERIMQDDAVCCKCQKYYSQEDKTVNNIVVQEHGVSRRSQLIDIVKYEQCDSAALHQKVVDRVMYRAYTVQTIKK